MATTEKHTVLNPLTLRNTVGEELLETLEARGIENAEELLGVAGLKDKERLSSKVMKKAADIMGEPFMVQYLTNFQNDYLKEKPRYLAHYKEAKLAFAKLKKVVPLLRGEFNEGYDVLDDILDFFGLDSAEEIFEASERQAALFLSQSEAKIDPVSLYAWLRRGELDFKAMSLSEYNEQALAEWIDSREWADHLADVDYFYSLPTLFSGFGVGLIFIEPMPHTACGAIRWFDGRPLIQISKCGKDLASCWFALFHELGHAIKHKEIEIYESGTDDSKYNHSKYETEANAFARQYL